VNAVLDFVQQRKEDATGGGVAAMCFGFTRAGLIWNKIMKEKMTRGSARA
jgi:hypothetical protein